MQQVRKINKKILMILALFIVLAMTLFAKVKAGDEEYPFNMTVHVEGKSECQVKAIDYYYRNGIYISLRDLALALMGTSKAYDISVSDKEISITNGKDYIATGGEGEVFSQEQMEADFLYTKNLSRVDMFVDGIERKYYTIIIPNAASRSDAYMSITDVAMLWDMNMKIDGHDLYIYPDQKLNINLTELEAKGYFDMVNSVLVGDVNTGEIYFSSKADVIVPMASTTKLMTYVVVMDAVRNGTISLDQRISFSNEALRIANSSDGVIKLQPEDTVTVEEALPAMLLPSSNEMAYALAETVAGSENAFVEMMNAKAESIGMTDTVFYNSNGLPSYPSDIFNQKRQNMITANDMFTLVCYINSVYPDIRDITSLKSYRIDSLAVTVKNTNPLLYNLEGVTGLKTGTTIGAGACLVTLMDIDENHSIAAMEFGAEDGYFRGVISELLLRYGKNAVNAGTGEENADAGDDEIDISTPEKLIQFLLN